MSAPIVEIKPHNLCSSCTLSRCFAILPTAGRSAVRLARSVWDAEVGGSNPLAPTSQYKVDIKIIIH